MVAAGYCLEFDDSGKAKITKTTIPGTTTQSTGTKITPTTTTPTTTTNDNDNSDVTPAPGSLSRFGGDSVVTTVRDGGLLEPTEIGSGSGATDRVGTPGVVLATTTITLGTILEDHRAHHQVPSCDWCGDECYTLQCPGCYMRFCDQCQRDGKLLG